MDPIKLSVLVCGIPERITTALPDKPAVAEILLDDLSKQAVGKPVEILYLLDNLKMTVGRKRSVLLSIAQGEWFTFVDDDDAVAPTYISRLLAATDEAPPDTGVICFGQECHHADTGEIEHCTYGLGWPYEKCQTYPGDNPSKEYDWRGLPAHTMCWRTDAVQSIEFPSGNFQEDVGWVAKACEVVKVDCRIPDVLYYYRFDPKTSRTREG